MAEFHLQSLADVHARVLRREVSILSIAQDYLQRIEAAEPVVQAFACLDREAVLEQASAADAAGNVDMLTGTLAGIKDVIDTADLPTGYGSALYEGFRPAADASCVSVLRQRGSLVMGKTVTTEFA